MATVQQTDAERRARKSARVGRSTATENGRDGVESNAVESNGDDSSDANSNGQASEAARATRAKKKRELETEDLLRRYRKRRTVKVRNELIERHRGAVEFIARALSARLPRSVDLQDLVHAGIWGMMQALESFDPRRRIPFSQFMRSRVRGAMLDELRNLDYVPRLYRQLHREREAAVQALRSELRRDPNDAEIASRLGVSEIRLRRVAATVRDPLQTNPDRPRSGDDLERGLSFGIDHLPDRDSAVPFEALDRKDLLNVIRDSLQPIEWQVLEMHYLQGIPGKEIARQLRLSASRICQIHGRVLSRLKARLGRG